MVNNVRGKPSQRVLYPPGRSKPPSTSGLGHRPFKPRTRVQIPLGERKTQAYPGHANRPLP